MIAHFRDTPLRCYASPRARVITVNVQATTEEPTANAHLREPFSDDIEFQEEMLRDVSRTFALTIPQLPERLRTVVGNAYLLCRIADTIEDSPALSIEQKLAFSEAFAAIVEGARAVDRFGVELAECMTHGSLDAERDLVRNTERVIRLTHSFSPPERAALSRCVRIMTGGMEEFQEGKFTDGLRDIPHLDAYCYHVAGVVGEMLCDLFCAYSPEVAKNREKLAALAVSFGQGLQMTNILKDIWDDKARNVVWLPRSVFDAHGFDLRELGTRKNDPGFRDGLIELIGVARGHLENALAYTLLIPKSEPGIRKFCLWAIGMAVLTLRKIHANPFFASGDEVKISRRAVRGVIAASNAACKNDFALKTLFAATSRGLSKT
ncbi:MAG: phytoene/squalene synthase family protein [Candidatus Hydrogenedentes bacterium]|nr:phytoene/squalene synthase family protein [Candidatus Hydrogenedentota bacterium]